MNFLSVFKNSTLFLLMLPGGLLFGMEPTSYSEQEEETNINPGLTIENELWDAPKNDEAKRAFLSRYGFSSIMSEAEDLLLKEDVKEVSDTAKYKWEPRRKGFMLLHCLLKLGHAKNINTDEYKKAVIELIKSGADLSVSFDKKPFKGIQPLHMALSTKANIRLDEVDDEFTNRVDALQEIIRELVNTRADLNAQDSDGYTPLLLATLLGDVESIELMLPYMEDLNGVTDKKMTALMLAAGFGSGEIVELLISYGANPTLTNKQEKTAYDQAVEKKQTEVAQVLAKYEKQWEAAHAEEPEQKRQRLSKEEE